MAGPNGRLAAANRPRGPAAGARTWYPHPAVAGLDDAEVQALARQCRLALTAAQVADHREHLAPLVQHLEILARVDVTDVPAYMPPGAPAGLRDDTPGPCLPVAAALAAAPSRRGEFVAVPRRPRT
jgi:aspartyl/glutamyl-tRNA(Asn/Gln) amidotransferase C subunit